MTRKIDAMHRYFGVTPGEHCKGCCHCISGQYRDKNYRKCDVYGMTHDYCSYGERKEADHE